jgi:hypothetical protein
LDNSYRNIKKVFTTCYIQQTTASNEQLAIDNIKQDKVKKGKDKIPDYASAHPN